LFIRLFAMSPPKPNNVPITIMLGSGTAGGADEDRLATRKPMPLLSPLGLSSKRDDDDSEAGDVEPDAAAEPPRRRIATIKKV
jgi:hypothetical protein